MHELAERHGARDTTARGTALAELEAMETRPSQYNPGQEIPEKSWAYRLAKRFWFNDYGMYGKHFRPEQWKETRESTELRLTREGEAARLLPSRCGVAHRGSAGASPSRVND